MDSGPFPLLWLCGPSGVGKSAVAWEIFTQVRNEGTAAAYLDIDSLAYCYPSRAADPGNDHLMAANVATLWPNYRAAGARCLLVSGCIDRPDLVPVYTTVPQLRTTLVRLRADRAILRERFLRRGRYADLVDAALREADELDRSGMDAQCIDTGGSSIVEVAATVRKSVGGWPNPDTIDAL